MKITTTGKSLIELYREYGTGSSGFWSKDLWWKDEAFAKEKPDAGEYEIDLGEELAGMTLKEQSEKIKKGFEITHPAVLAEAILAHFKKTRERLLESKYSRTSSLDSCGYRVYVGLFAADGLRVAYYWGDRQYDFIGLSSARKVSGLDARRLEASIKTVKEAGYKVIK